MLKKKGVAAVFGPGTPTAVIPTRTPAVLNVPNPKTDPIVPQELA